MLIKILKYILTYDHAITNTNYTTTSRRARRDRLGSLARGHAHSCSRRSTRAF